ncbi:hypothetical protein [Asticcacaulis sp.]|uniref:hypothetical protein n=1 Tax=Asticcacaulis sp. TaxID=1872648 RepID=UPI002CE50E58|nr:hypothetical protein [Asticcacaulis sp.]HTM80749.1 hypothetical protein [Asticcacaulis sp.]
MIIPLPKRLAPAFICLCLIATGAWAQTQEQVQERLVDSVKTAEQEANSAAAKFKANDAAGGCTDLRATAADTAASLELARQLSGLISENTALNEETRGRMLQDVLSLSATLVSQKQGMDTQITARCN